MRSSRANGRKRKITQLLKPGDCFAFDTESCVGGDILYAEVIDVLPKFPSGIDSVGEGTGGYFVLVHCNEAPDIHDYYAWDYVDDTCVRLSRVLMERARAAGWPSPRAFLRKHGVEVPRILPSRRRSPT